MLDNIGVIKICSHMGTTLHKRLIEYNMRNIFLEKLYTKYGGETSPRPFSGKLKLNTSLDQ